jgi:hypothetical protein
VECKTYCQPARVDTLKRCSRSSKALVQARDAACVSLQAADYTPVPLCANQLSSAAKSFFLADGVQRRAIAHVEMRGKIEHHANLKEKET